MARKFSRPRRALGVVGTLGVLALIATACGGASTDSGTSAPTVISTTAAETTSSTASAPVTSESTEPPAEFAAGEIPSLPAIIPQIGPYWFVMSYFEGQFVAVKGWGEAEDDSGYAQVFASSDGATWQRRAIVELTHPIITEASGSGEGLVLSTRRSGRSGQFALYTSTDLTNFTAVEPFLTRLDGLDLPAGFTISATHRTIAGSAWLTESAALAYLADAPALTGRLGELNNPEYTFADGTSYQPGPRPEFNDTGAMSSLVRFGDDGELRGQTVTHNATTFYDTGDHLLSRFYAFGNEEAHLSTDGENWTPHTLNLDGIGREFSGQMRAFNGRLYVATLIDNGIRILVSEDLGQSWIGQDVSDVSFGGGSGFVFAESNSPGDTGVAVAVGSPASVLLYAADGVNFVELERFEFPTASADVPNSVVRQIVLDDERLIYTRRDQNSALPETITLP